LAISGTAAVGLTEVLDILDLLSYAGVVKLADARDSKSRGL
jgi:hypothetical protein